MKKKITKKLGDMTEKEIRQVRNRLYKFKKDCFNCHFRCNDVIMADACLAFDILWKGQIENNKDLEFEVEVENETGKLELYEWKTMDEYFDKKHDWVLVQFEEIGTGFRGLPHIAEWRARKDKQGWFLQDDDKEEYFTYINVNCKPIAFCELPHYKE